MQGNRARPPWTEKNIQRVPFEFGLPDRLYDPLKLLPDIHKRVMCAIYFAQVSQADDCHLKNCKAQFIPQIREAYFRAALAEFSAATEVEILKRDLAVAKINAVAAPLHKIECKEALLFRELRNLEFHMTTGKLKEDFSQVYIRFKPSDTHTIPHKLNTWILQFDRAKFLTLKNVRNYWNECDVEKWLNWLDENQRACGLHRVFVFAVQKYVEGITSRYRLKSL